MQSVHKPENGCLFLGSMVSNVPLFLGSWPYNCPSSLSHHPLMSGSCCDTAFCPHIEIVEEYIPQNWLLLETAMQVV